MGRFAAWTQVQSLWLQDSNCECFRQEGGSSITMVDMGRLCYVILLRSLWEIWRWR